MTPTTDERAALPPAQGVLLWSMRAWVLGLARSTDMGARIRGAFAGVEAEDAAPGLSGFMQAVEDGGIRAVDVGRMCSHKVTADERLLLDIFRMVQAGDAASAARTLRGMVSSGSVAAVLGFADDVASALLDAGHRLTPEADAPRRRRATPRCTEAFALSDGTAVGPALNFALYGGELGGTMTAWDEVARGLDLPHVHEGQ